MISAGQLIHNWNLSKLRLTFAKKEELRWRMLVTLKLFPNADIGTTHGHGLVLTQRETFSVDKDLSKVSAVIARLQKECPTDGISTLFAFTPTISKQAYEALSDEAKNIVAEVLTIKPALASLKKKGESDADGS